MIDIKESPPEKVDVKLDTSGLNCPLPILKTKKALNDMENDEVIQVTTTDPLAPLDFKAFCVHAAHNLIHVIEKENDVHIFYIMKGSR